jgi:hypothetical protein
MLAVLGNPQVYSAIKRIGASEALGPQRYELLGIFGHAAVVPELLVKMECRNPLVASRAAAAFTRITACEVQTETVAVVRANDPAAESPQEEEIEVNLPDLRLAHAYWEKHSNRYWAGTRWSHGVEVSRPLSPPEIHRLDLRTRWEISLREHFFGRRPSKPEGGMSDIL